MFGSFGIFCVCVLRFLNWGHCDTITAFEPGISYSWIIPPRPSQSQSADTQRPPEASIDRPNESAVMPVGGYGHPPFYLRHSHEQLSLPNEFLITPLDPHSRIDGTGLSLSQQPIFQQFDTNKPLMNQNHVDCDGKPSCPNVDISSAQQQDRPHQEHQQHQPRQHATIMQMQQSNIAPVASIAHNQRGSDDGRGQPMSWPTSGSSFGLLFFVPDSASHLPVEQLIQQQLALHRTQLPFDISINCGDATATDVSRCLSGVLNGGVVPQPFASSYSTAASWSLEGMVDGRNTENGNYASPPLFDIVNSSGSRSQQRKWRTLGERIVRNKHQHQNQLQQQQQQMST